MGVADELARLIAHRDAGTLTDEEFQAAKADLLAHPERARTEPEVEAAEPVSSRRRRNRRGALVVAALIVLALVGWVVVSEAMIGGARLEVRVTSVTAVNADVVKVHATVTNVGGRTSLGICQVAVRLSGSGGSSPIETPPEPLTTSPVPPGATTSGTAEVVVVAGGAQRVTSRDLSFSCQ
ncbi:MAG TPA: SHOCT domain-containing protein [Acidimicrobiales bacterium]|nr:MAG: hypothetical protein B7Z69_00830 [Actinobacteria bacterium 21-73-9]HQU26155.1 SHOCT domain-containing protein [Acidimicrobiales bacterium]